MTNQTATPRTEALSLDSAIRAIRAFGDLFDNRSTLDEDLALDAFQAGRAAYWSKAGYSNARATLVLGTANTCDLETALRLHASDDHPSVFASVPYLLGTLIPLNKLAVEDLTRAWSAIGESEAAIRSARAKHPEPMFAGGGVIAMADWRRQIKLQPEWGDAQSGALPYSALAGVIAGRLKALKPFGTAIDDERDEIVERFEAVATNERATADDFDAVMRDLYDWGE